MNKDVWHTADITPDPCRILICKTNKGQNYTAIIPSPQEWNTMILPEFYNLGDIDNAERIEQYTYLDDLLALETKLERTRKALEMAVDALKDIRCIYTGDQTTKPSTMFGRAASALNKIQDLEQITAILENKNGKC